MMKPYNIITKPILEVLKHGGSMPLTDLESALLSSKNGDRHIARLLPSIMPRITCLEVKDGIVRYVKNAVSYARDGIDHDVEIALFQAFPEMDEWRLRPFLHWSRQERCPQGRTWLFPSDPDVAYPFIPCGYSHSDGDCEYICNDKRVRLSH